MSLRDFRFVCCLLCCVVAAVIGGTAPGSARTDQGGQAYQERLDKDLMPYGKIKKLAEKRFNGRVVNQDLLAEPRQGPPRYKLRLIRRDGSVLDVTIDARTGDVLDVKGNN